MNTPAALSASSSTLSTGEIAALAELYLEDSMELTDGPEGLGCESWEDVATFLQAMVQGQDVQVPSALRKDWELFLANV